VDAPAPSLFRLCAVVETILGAVQMKESLSVADTVPHHYEGLTLREVGQVLGVSESTRLRSLRRQCFD
jgi:DNA-directed RNA polymerase specialized sigma subunit